jgi:hypothetical protein
MGYAIKWAFEIPQHHMGVINYLLNFLTHRTSSNQNITSIKFYTALPNQVNTCSHVMNEVHEPTVEHKAIVAFTSKTRSSIT